PRARAPGACGAAHDVGVPEPGGVAARRAAREREAGAGGVTGGAADLRVGVVLPAHLDRMVRPVCGTHELHDSIEQPARFLAHSGRLRAYSSRPGWSSYGRRSTSSSSRTGAYSPFSASSMATWAR